jgi:hypothetical protein
MNPILAGLVSATTILVALALAARRPSPALPTALMALATPVLAYALYYQPFPEVLFALLLIAGLAGGVTLQRRAAQIGPRRIDPTQMPILLQAIWSAAYMWQQFAELGHSYAAFRVGVALFAAAGGVWAGYLVAARVSAPVTARLVTSPAMFGGSPLATLEPVRHPPSVAQADVSPTDRQPAPLVAQWAPTHRVPEKGLDCWEAPDVSRTTIARLDPGLEVEVTERWGDWTRVVCSNGWSAWLDGRALEESGVGSEVVTSPVAPPIAWTPTHRAPAGGLSCWASPVASSPVIAQLDPLLEVAVVERSGDWAHVVCSNHWAAWVDGRLLEEVARIQP